MSYEIGFIKNVQGLKGAVLVNVRTDFDRFSKNKTIYLYEDGKKINLKIKNTHETKKGLVVSFFNYDNINEVESFKGKKLYTDEQPILDTNEFHEEDILNKDVYNQENKYIGQVIKVLDVPQGHILRIKTEEKEVLVPFNDYFIIKVSEDKIVINEIEGLIWKLTL